MNAPHQPARPAAYVTLGQQRYRVKHVSHAALSGITDVSVFDDRIVVLRRQAPELVTLARDGSLLNHSVDLPQFVCGHGLRTIDDGLLAASDMDGHKIVLLDARMNEVARLHCNERPALGRPFNHPCDCARGPDARYYVADGYGNSAVHIFDSDLRHLKSFGQAGTGPGEFSTPHSLIFDSRGRLCVADRENNRIQQFDAEGNWLGQIDGLHKPMALALCSDGTLLVSDQTPRLSAYDPNGQLIGRCRSFSTYAHGLAVQQDGTIVMAEMAPDRVTLLVPAP
ncbi:6-bladed beta-propeller [Sulfitobacter sp.]|uniref:6-bladed beta-propeller n=1 Tax=Sulfitobacter sp. TaxID=1903071 RepID=UPI003296E9C5